MIVALLMAQAVVSSVGQTGGVTAESVGSVNQPVDIVTEGSVGPVAGQRCTVVNNGPVVCDDGCDELVWLRYVWQPKERFFAPVAWFESEAACKAVSPPPGPPAPGGVSRTFCGAVGYGRRGMEVGR